MGSATAAFAGSINWSMGWTSSSWESSRWGNSSGKAHMEQNTCALTYPFGDMTVQYKLYRDINLAPDAYQRTITYKCDGNRHTSDGSAENGSLYIQLTGISGESATATGKASS